MFCRTNDVMCLWRNVWRVEMFTPTPGRKVAMQSRIKPAVLRITAISAVCSQTIYQYYGTMKRKFRTSLYNSLLSNDFDGKNAVMPAVS